MNRLSTPDEVVVKVTYKGNRILRYRDEFALSSDTIKLKLKLYTVSSTSALPRLVDTG